MMSTDWQSIRDEFPALSRCTWLNTATFGQVPLRAQAAIEGHFEKRNQLGARDFLSWFDMADEIRNDVAWLFHATADDVAFIPHTSFALSLIVNAIDWRPGDEVVTFENEFPNQIYAATLLEERGVKLVRAVLGEWRDALSERTRLVALTQANYATGEEAPVEEMSRILRDRKILFYLDGTQSAGVRAFDFPAIEPDLYAVNSYKWMNTPPGTGFMLVPLRTRQWLQPNVVGWRSHWDWRNVNQLHTGKPEFAEAAERYEGGMLPFINLFAMQASIRLVLSIGPTAVEERVLELAAAIRDVLRETGADLLGDHNPRANGHIVAARIPGADPGEVARALQAKDVLVSARHGFLRVSPHYYNNHEDVARFAEVLKETLAHA